MKYSQQGCDLGLLTPGPVPLTLLSSSREPSSYLLIYVHGEYEMQFAPQIKKKTWNIIIICIMERKDNRCLQNPTTHLL